MASRSTMERIGDLYQKSFPIIILLPALIIGGIVLVYPLINGVLLSLTNYTTYVPKYNWVGIKNFITLFRDPIYWEVIFNSFFIVFLSVTVQASFGMIISLLLNSDVPFRGFFRSCIFIIWIIPMIVVSLLWMIIFNSEFGILNYVLVKLGLIKENIFWLGQPWPAKFALIITYGWRGVPFFMVMLLAALQTIPQDIIDASKIDGATNIKRFRFITIPFIKHILLLSCLLSTVRLFQDITLIYILTNGGPMYSTTTLAIHVYKEAFTSMFIGKAAAIGVTWLIILFTLAIFYVRMVTKTEFRK